MKSLRSAQKTPKLSYRKATVYISTTRKFSHLFNFSMLVLFKKCHGFLKYWHRKFYIIRIPQTIRLRYEKIALTSVLLFSDLPGLIFSQIQEAFPRRPHMKFLYQLADLRVRPFITPFYSHNLKILNFLSLC
jgi:hypothetical protein